MYCVKCNEDMVNCECSDMPERLEKVCKVVLFDKDYLERLTKQAWRVKGMN